MDIQFLDFLQQPTLNNALLCIFLLIALSFIPFMPMPAVYSAIALTFPIGVSLSISLLGSVIGALCMYMLCKTVLARYYSRKIEKLHSHYFIRLARQNGFSAILLARLIPIFPSAVINIIAGVLQLRFWPFVCATFLGKIPTIIMFTLTGNQLMQQNYSMLLYAGIYLAFLILIANGIHKNWRKKDTR
ncbi:TVP38/TMEM64 family protein [Kurthia sibirica]|uniref:TVP38/TMEM64 family membrane protein n=1 Tax=Kurthia sibirica TaxID=202750 RepID=A0A2U3ANZ3_9BACL|nr:VTT domain-containing protein [Kurthia sibirica]PWI26270.1 hypothetical protein DEX24_04915 [Kurthia sibirica]GEK33885.1 hypothetical protein KSI01_14180 [Kurthia sibirica]